MAKKTPGMFLIAAALLVVAVAMGYGSLRVFNQAGGASRFLGSLLALAALFVLLLAVACVVLAFGVDFK